MPTSATANKPPHATRFWVIAGLGVVGVALLLHSGAFQGFVAGATGWAEGVMKAHPILGAVVFVLFSTLSAMLVFTSSVVLVPAANLVWGKWVTFALLLGGWVAGAMIAYGIGKLAEPMLVRLGYQEKLEKYQQFVSKRMKFWAVLVFCFAVPSEVPGYLFGSLKYPFWKFTAAIAIAESIYGVGIIAAGESLREARPGAVLMAIGAMVVIAVAAGFFLRRLKGRKGKATANRR
ncbi:MAG TPA: VTT domain-containing protein [Prosthecobacter sp.]|nr:VTT domain-containing protein [Prosthecobacter sp.]